MKAKLRSFNPRAIRKNYYSVYIPECDANYASDVKVLEHENCMGIDDETLDNDLGNHFKTKREANAARKEIIRILRLLKG